MQPLSLLLIGNFAPVPGAAPIGSELAEQLTRAGHRVRCASARTSRLLRLHDMLHTAWRDRREYGAAEVDVYSGRAFLWAEAAVEVLRRARKPFVLRLHGGALPAFAAKHGRRVRRLLGFASAVAAPSRYLADALAPLRPGIGVLPNAIELGRYTFRRRASVAPKLIWLRAFHRIYNPDMAVRTMAQLAPALPEAHLEMIGRDKGDGTLEAARRLARRLGVEDRVDFIPGIPNSQVPARLAAADIFLNTSQVDNAPISVLEAMATGLCVVSTDAGGLPHATAGAALLVARDDAAAMAQALRRLVDDPELAAACSSAARGRAELCDWSVILPAWERLLASVLA